MFWQLHSAKQRLQTQTTLLENATPLTKTGDNTARCNVCKTIVSVKGGNTCTVRFHNMGLNSRNAVRLLPNEAAPPLAGEKYPAEITSAPRRQASQIYLYD